MTILARMPEAIRLTGASVDPPAGELVSSGAVFAAGAVAVGPVAAGSAFVVVAISVAVACRCVVVVLLAVRLVVVTVASVHRTGARVHIGDTRGHQGLTRLRGFFTLWPTEKTAVVPARATLPGCGLISCGLRR